MLLEGIGVLEFFFYFGDELGVPDECREAFFVLFGSVDVLLLIFNDGFESALVFAGEDGGEFFFLFGEVLEGQVGVERKKKIGH